jgi:chromosome segregation ATPase
LSRERDAALKYKQLETELNSLRTALVWKEFTESEKGLGDIDEKLAEKKVESEKLNAEIKSYDSQLTEFEQKLEKLTKELLHASDQIEVTKKLTKLRSDVERARDKLASNDREVQRIGEMIERMRSFDGNVNPAVKAVLNEQGVCGTLSNLITVPGKYSVAVEVAGGAHMQDLVVDNTSIAVRCVKYLKDNKIGRARFLPLDKIRGPIKQDLPRGTLGWVSELIHHEPKYTPVVEFVFGRTAAVNDIDKGKDIARSNRLRMVTLDGDLLEESGAITGGFYNKKGRQGPDVTKYADERKKLEEESEGLEIQLREMNGKLEELAGKEEKLGTASFERERVKLDESMKKVRYQRKEAYERILTLQQEIGKLNIQKARIEAKFDNLKVQMGEKSLKGLKGAKEDEVPEELKKYVELEIPELEKRQHDAVKEIETIGLVNMKALEDFDLLKAEFDEFRDKVDKIVIEKESIESTLNVIEDKRKETFMLTLDEIAKHFRVVYSELTGGEAALELENPQDIESGLMIRASPPGKKLLNIDSMSGGEKTLTAFTFLFAVQRHKPTPFYVLDEADAALDKINTKKIASLIKKQSALAQFIAISHNDSLVTEADQVYGVTMEEGESKIMGLKLPKSGEQPMQTDEDFEEEDDDDDGDKEDFDEEEEAPRRKR